MTPARHTPVRITDPRAVAAITHPTRMQLLGELSRRGPSRVADLAREVGAPANSVSFHLRQLARYGLIEHDPTAGADGRERWWRMASDRGFDVDIESVRAQPGGEAAVGVLDRIAEGHVIALHRATQQRNRHARVIQDDFALRLSDEEVTHLRSDIADLLDRWAALSRSRSDDGVERHPYYGIVLGAPVDALASVYEEQ